MKTLSNFYSNKSLVKCELCTDEVWVRPDRLDNHIRKVHKIDIKDCKTNSTASLSTKLSKRKIKIGSKVYAKLGKKTPERLFTVTAIIDKDYLEVQDCDGVAHELKYTEISTHPAKKEPTQPESQSKSIFTISIPSGGINRKGRICR